MAAHPEPPAALPLETPELTQPTPQSRPWLGLPSHGPDQVLRDACLTPALTNTSHFLSIDLPVLDIFYKWNHTLCGLWV